MSKTVRAIDGISILRGETYEEQRDAIRRTIRHGVLANYRNRHDTRTVTARRKVVNGLPKTKHKVRRVQIVITDPVYMVRRPSQLRLTERAESWLKR